METLLVLTLKRFFVCFSINRGEGGGSEEEITHKISKKKKRKELQ